MAPPSTEISPAPPLPDWLARQLPASLFRRSLVESDGLCHHVLEAGPEDAPRTVVLLHGNPTWSFLWRHVMRALVEDPGAAPLRLVAPDLMGLGLSDKPRDPTHHTLEEHARRVGRLVDVLAPGRALFVGQDWGGPIGLLAYAARRARLAGVVVGNTVVGPPREGFRPSTFHRFARLPLVSDVAFRLLGFPQLDLARAQGERASIRGDVARAYRWPLRRIVDRTAPLALARMVPDSLAHPSVAGLRAVEQLVRGLEAPSEIVWGERDPVIGRARRRVEEMMPRARVTVTEAGHFLQEEVPGELAAAVRRVAHAARW